MSAGDSDYQITGRFTGVDEIVAGFRSIDASVKQVTGSLGALVELSSQNAEQTRRLFADASVGGRQRIEGLKAEATLLIAMASGLERLGVQAGRIPGNAQNGSDYIAGTTALSSAKQGYGYLETARQRLVGVVDGPMSTLGTGELDNGSKGSGRTTAGVTFDNIPPQSPGAGLWAPPRGTVVLARALGIAQEGAAESGVRSRAQRGSAESKTRDASTISLRAELVNISTRSLEVEGGGRSGGEGGKESTGESQKEVKSALEAMKSLKETMELLEKLGANSVLEALAGKISGVKGTVENEVKGAAESAKEAAGKGGNELGDAMGSGLLTSLGVSLASAAIAGIINKREEGLDADERARLGNIRGEFAENEALEHATTKAQVESVFTSKGRREVDYVMRLGETGRVDGEASEMVKALDALTHPVKAGPQVHGEMIRVVTPEQETKQREENESKVLAALSAGHIGSLAQYKATLEFGTNRLKLGKAEDLIPKFHEFLDRVVLDSGRGDIIEAYKSKETELTTDLKSKGVTQEVDDRISYDDRVKEHEGRPTLPPEHAAERRAEHGSQVAPAVTEHGAEPGQSFRTEPNSSHGASKAYEGEIGWVKQLIGLYPALTTGIDSLSSKAVESTGTLHALGTELAKLEPPSWLRAPPEQRRDGPVRKGTNGTGEDTNHLPPWARFFPPQSPLRTAFRQFPPSPEGTPSGGISKPQTALGAANTFTIRVNAPVIPREETIIAQKVHEAMERDLPRMLTEALKDRSLKV